MDEKTKNSVVLGLTLIMVLVLGAFIGNTFSSDTDLSPVIDECNKQIRACYDQLINRTQCETKFVFIKNFDNDTTFTTQP